MPGATLPAEASISADSAGFVSKKSTPQTRIGGKGGREVKRRALKNGRGYLETPQETP